MYLQAILLAVCLLSFPADAGPFRRRGTESLSLPFAGSLSFPLTSNWNRSATATPTPSGSLTSAASLSDSSLTWLPRLTPTPSLRLGTGVYSNHVQSLPTGISGVPTASSNNSGSPCTVNVYGNIDWWYPPTYTMIVATMAPFIGANYSDGQPRLTKVDYTTSFDVNSALSEDAYTPSASYDSEWDVTFTFNEPYTVKPTAAVTSVVSRTGFRSLPSDGIIKSTDFRNYVYDGDLPSATLAIVAANRTQFVATSATAALIAASYEVQRAMSVTAEDGRTSRSIYTETFKLSYANTYQLDGIEESAVATGSIPSALMASIPQSSCQPGFLQATVTMLIVVDLYIIHYPSSNPFIVHIESSVLGFEDPTLATVAGIQQASVTRARNSEQHMPLIQQTATGFNDAESASKPALIAGVSTQAPLPKDTASHTVGTIASSPVVIGPSSVVAVGSQTLQPGGDPVTIGGVPVSLDSSGTAIVIASRTSMLPNVAVPALSVAAPILTVGSSTLTGNAATQYYLGPGQTLTAGGIATIDNTIVSLAPSANFVVIGGSTQPLASVPAAVATQGPYIVVAGSTFTANAGSSFVLGDKTLAPGQQVTWNGQTVSLAPAANSVVVNGVSSGVTAIPAERPVIMVGSSYYTADASGTFVVKGQTLVPGGQAVTVDGTALSLGPSASMVVLNGATSTIANFAIPTITPAITLGTSTWTAGSGGTFVIDGQTLAPGQVITVEGTTISLGPSASYIVIDGATSVLNSPAQITQGPVTSPPLLTIDKQTFTALPGSGTTFVIAGETLTPGGTIVLEGLTISLSPGATQLVYGSMGHSTTEALFPATTTMAVSLTTELAQQGATGGDGSPRETAGKKSGARHLGTNLYGLFVGVLSSALLICLLG